MANPASSVEKAHLVTALPPKSLPPGKDALRAPDARVEEQYGSARSVHPDVRDLEHCGSGRAADFGDSRLA